MDVTIGGMEYPAPSFFYQELVENTDTLVFEVDTQGCYTYMNAAWERVLGYSREEMLGHSFRQFRLNPEQAVDESEILGKLQAGEACAHETSCRRKDGSVVYLSFQLKASLSPEGNIQKIQGMGHDISQRVRTEQALSVSEELFRIHVENSFDVIFTLDQEGRFLYVSPSWEKHFGYDPKSLIGTAFAPFVHPDDIAPLAQYLGLCLQSGACMSSPEYRVRHADGHWVWFIANGTPYKDRNGRLEYVGVAHSIAADKKIRETIAEKNKEMERLAYVASHDLRSPLLNIDGFARSLRESVGHLRELLGQVEAGESLRAEIARELDEDMPESLDYIGAAAQKMECIIQGLLQVSRTGRQQLDIQPIDMNALLGNVLSAYHYSLEQCGGQVNVATLPPCYGDAALVNQLFSNLLGNAIKYRHPGRPLMLNLTAEPDFERIRYSLRDNGIGMNPEHLERIWDVFYRVQDQGDTSGEGLGLSIIRRIANQHQGRAWAESEPGVGSVFHIELPSVPSCV